VTLVFESLPELIDFSLVIHLTKYNLDGDRLTISTELSDAEIELAREGFGARLEAA
jgi:hypothetical protein